MPQYGGGGYEVRTRRANLSQRMQVAKGLGTRMEALAKRVTAPGAASARRCVFRRNKNIGLTSLSGSVPRQNANSF